MEMLLTPDQESTLWHFADTIITDSGKKYMFFPYWLRVNGEGSYERLRFDQIPEEVKDKLLIKQGIILPGEIEPNEGFVWWLKEQDNVVKVDTDLYTLTFKGVECVCSMYRLKFSDDITIRPVNPMDDIGNGCGQSYSIAFAK